MTDMNEQEQQPGKDAPQTPQPDEPVESPQPAVEPVHGQDEPQPSADEPAGEAQAAHEHEDSPPACAAPAELPAAIEAILFASEKPLAPGKINEVAQAGGVRNVRAAVEQLNARYEQMGCSFRIMHVAGGFQMQTLPEYSGVLSRLVKTREDNRLSQAAMETLAIVAYRQPVLRADVEAIRGVASGEMLHRLMEVNLVKIVGRAEEIGRPLLYGTTKHFLEIFGLGSLEDLPNAEQLKAPPKEKKKAKEQPAPAETPAAEASPQAEPPAAESPEAETGEPTVPDAQADGTGADAPDRPADQ